MKVDIRALEPKDNRKSFDCGDEALNLYFHQYAGQNQFRHHVGVSYVAVADQNVLGFATVTPATLDATGLPGKRLPNFPIPVLRIARLAVDRRFKREGVGKALLRFCFSLAWQMQREYGCVGVLVDAKPDAAPFYSRLGFEEVELVAGGSHVRPRPTPMYLPLGSIPK